MNLVLIGICGALGACVVVLGVLVAALSRRASRRGDERVGTVVQALETRMDELARDLAGAVERAEEESRRSRFLSGIAGSIDLDEVLERTLEAAEWLPGVDAAIVRLPGESEPLVAAHGISAEQAERQALSGPPDGSSARAVELVYRYAEEGPGDAIRSGIAVPLADGLLAIFTRDAARRFGDDDVKRLEELAERAGPAIDNARQFREARLQADLDALTGLHNRRYFHETLAREVARAHRYGRTLALVLFDLDDFKEINDRLGHLGGDSVLAEAAERLREAVRSADIPCRVGGDEFGVIVPEAGQEEAQLLIARVQRAISSRPLAQAGRVRLSAGSAELRTDDDAVALFERADGQLYASKPERRGGLSAAGDAG
ncbi:MAG TPA: sensor domain-containing diguanylate cyclase [Gaiellaceae bacterium]|nr:sensor domain-containing diguanylate cyclase [Gaiellaceae bacterium]